MGRQHAVLLSVAALAGCMHVGAMGELDGLLAPNVEQALDRPASVEDVLNVRRIDTLSVSPDGSRYAILVRRMDADANEYRTGWFVGKTRGGQLTYVGSGGQLVPQGAGQNIVGSESRWSPDGEWIAYLATRGGQVQLWRSRVDGSAQEQVTQNAADVRDFAWRADGRAIYFTVGASRAKLESDRTARILTGYRYDDDLYQLGDLLRPSVPGPTEVELSKAPQTWSVELSEKRERIANQTEQAEFEDARSVRDAGRETPASYYRNAAITPIAGQQGRAAWLVRQRPQGETLRVVAMTSTSGSDPITCDAEACSGLIKKVWWSEDGEHVLFWRTEGVENWGEGIYSWLPSNGTVRPVFRTLDDELRDCSPAAAEQFVCVRESALRPPHVVTIDLGTGAVRVLADVNSQFKRIRLSEVERFEWSTPRFDWNESGGKLEGLYPSKAFGRIFYPPNFDPRKKYPTIVEPYNAVGFNSSVGGEHALLAYAANGFIVLNLNFPHPIDAEARLGASSMKTLYSPELNFPHMSMLMESTLRAIDVVAARGFIDVRRVGIGGISHGTFIPLYLLQKHDRIAAISISGPGWGPNEYYNYTRSDRLRRVASSGKVGFVEWRVKPEGAGKRFWSLIDIADHVDAVEAPILMQSSAKEALGMVRLIRHMSDADRPYDAYVFTNEGHNKWQPAHLRAAMRRNLDWFRFWLQDIEDPDLTKSEQYERWRGLRKLQCHNPRSLRDYCHVVSAQVPITH